jgi:polysaccharide pyruvyl transferase WcaK-like protein
VFGSGSLIRRPRILLCGETHSPNLGDGVISDCLSHLVVRSVGGVTAETFDISLRPGTAEHSEEEETTRTIWRRAHRRLSSRSYTYRTYVNRIIHTRRLERHQRAIDDALEGTDLVIVGGGQLVQDSALSFPLKLDILVRACSDRGIPVVFFSVGVGTKWSRRGWELCNGVMVAPVVRRIYCRDQASAEFLRARLRQAAAGKVRTTFDVALLAGRVYRTAPRDRGLVGIGVISPSVTTRRDPHHPLSARRRSMAFHRELCSTLVERGKRVELFTNGSVDDHRFAEAIYRSLRRTRQSSRHLSLADRPPSADALVDRISRYAWIMAGRLHANVIAESLGTPWIGFGWDEKVMAFARMVSKQECVVAVPRDARSVLEHCSVCLAGPRRESRRDLWEACLHNDITEVLSLVSGGDHEAP